MANEVVIVQETHGKLSLKKMDAFREALKTRSISMGPDNNELLTWTVFVHMSLVNNCVLFFCFMVIVQFYGQIGPKM